MRKPTHLVKTILACYYQEIATGRYYPTDDNIRRRAALTQFKKKEVLGTIDPKILAESIKRYLKEQEQEIKNFKNKIKVSK